MAWAEAVNHPSPSKGYKDMLHMSADFHLDKQKLHDHSFPT